MNWFSKLFSKKKIIQSQSQQYSYRVLKEVYFNGTENYIPEVKMKYEDWERITKIYKKYFPLSISKEKAPILNLEEAEEHIRGFQEQLDLEDSDLIVSKIIYSEIPKKKR